VSPEPVSGATGAHAARLRIAAHISASEWGGAERRSLALLAGLAQRGHDIVVYCNTERIAGIARDAGLPAVISPLRGDIMFGNALGLARHLRRQQPDVLLLITFRRLLLGALAGRLARVPRTISRVGLASDVARSAKYRFVLRRWIDDVVVNADSLRDPFIAALPEGAGVAVHVIPNGVQPRDTTMSRDEARTLLGVPHDAFVIGSVGRLVKQKRFDRLLDAAALLRAGPEGAEAASAIAHTGIAATANPGTGRTAMSPHARRHPAAPVHVVIAGDGYERDSLERQAADHGMAEAVHLPGHREDVGVVHRALDVYVVSSDQEGMSSGMLEAMAAGLPVVSTDVSGASEALAGSQQAGIVTALTASSLADGIRALMDDVALRRTCGQEAANVARERYGFDVMVDRWEALLGSRGGRT
jgi:glycosyltransferase involved in cell wall biosynthesis